MPLAALGRAVSCRELLAAITVPNHLVSTLLVPNSDSNSLYGLFPHCAGIELFILLITLGTTQNWHLPEQMAASV